MLFAVKGEALFNFLYLLFALTKMVLNQGVGGTVIVALVGLGLLACFLWWIGRNRRSA